MERERERYSEKCVYVCAWERGGKRGRGRGWDDLMNSEQKMSEVSFSIREEDGIRFEWRAKKKYIFSLLLASDPNFGNISDFYYFSNK